MKYDDLSPMMQRQLDQAERAYDYYRARGNTRKGEIIRYATSQFAYNNNPDYLRAIQYMRHVPVTIDEFLESEEFLGQSVGNISVWPALRDDLRDMHPDQMLGGQPILEVLLGGATGCVDGETEYLSPRGWVKIKDYPLRTKVAQYNAKTGKVNFVRPKQFIKKPCDKFYHFTGHGVDQMLSSEHRVLYKDADDELKVESAESVAQKVQSNSFSGKFLTTFKVDSSDLEIDDDSFAAMVLCIFKGKYIGYTNKCILDFDCRVSLRLACNALTGAGLEYESLGENSLYVRSPCLHNNFPESFYLCNDSQIEIIRNIISMFWKDQILECKNHSDANFIQYILCRSDTRTIVKGNKVHMFYHDIEVKPFAVKEVDVSSEDPYKYCFEVDTSFLVLRRNGKVFVTGNTGKSFLCSVSICYVLYFLYCFSHPQRLFPSLDRFTPIIVTLQSVTEGVARKVLYKPIRQMFTEMPYVKKWVKYNKQKDHALELSNGIEMAPGIANRSAYIGQAVIAGVIDEINFLSVIEQSKQVAGPDGKGGMYDQAKIIYNELTRRRKSRFLTRGPNPGGFYVPSSVHYEDDFLEKRIKEVDPVKDTHVKVIKRKQYEAQPADKYCGEKFQYLVSTKDYPAKIILPSDIVGVDYPKSAELLNIPIEYEENFRNDPEAAQRDILGIASGAINRYIHRVDKIVDAMERSKICGLKPWVNRQNVELAKHGMPEIIAENLPNDKNTPRFVHVDLSLSKDRCGIGIAKVSGYENRNSENGLMERLPRIQVELAVSLQPSAARTVDIAEVRRWIFDLREVYGINIVKVTYDQAHSAESRQLWRKAGIACDLLSVDRDPQPYDDLKRLLYEDRIDIIHNDLLHTELCTLEKNEIKNKIDHSSKSTKDLSDGVCGAVQGALRSRMVRQELDIMGVDGDSISHKREPKKTKRRTSIGGIKYNG